MTTFPITTPSRTDALLKRLPAKVALGATAMAIPVGFLAYTHIGWMKTPQAKKRMALHQAIFWGGMATSLTLLHAGAFWKKLPFTQIPVTGPLRAAIGLVGGLLGASAFKGGLVFSQKAFPKTMDKASLNLQA